MARRSRRKPRGSRRSGEAGTSKAGSGSRRRSAGRRAQKAPRGKALSRRAFLKVGLSTAAVAVVGGATGGYTAGRVNDVGRFAADRLAELRAGRSTLLFERYPGLAEVVPWRPIGAYPTPVEVLPSPAGASDVDLRVKRDDLGSPIYGGNKLRKLEYFLAEAQLAGSRTIVTMGGIGTNHGLATALHGRELGFAVRLALFEQPLTPFVRHNLRGFAAAGAQVRYGGGELGALWAARALHEEARLAGENPYFIMVGGSSRLGTVGYVNAAFELAEQVRAGVLAEPSRIFVALGSGGTAAGLAAGCKLAGLQTRVTAIRVSQRIIANAFTVRYLANDVLAWLRRSDPGVPRVRVGFGDFDVMTDQLGSGYGHPTQTGAAAAEWVSGRLSLETTYTAKALAACLRYCQTEARPNERVLFWNTFNSTRVAQPTSLDTLPAPLRAFAARDA